MGDVTTANLYVPGSATSSMNSYAFSNVYDGIESILKDESIKGTENKKAEIIKYLKEERLRRSEDVESINTKPSNDVLANPYEQARLDKAVRDFFSRDPVAMRSGISADDVLKSSLPTEQDERSEATKRGIAYKPNDYFSANPKKDYGTKFNHEDPTLDTWLSSHAEKADGHSQMKNAAKTDIIKTAPDTQEAFNAAKSSFNNALNSMEEDAKVKTFHTENTDKLFAGLEEDYKKHIERTDIDKDAPENQKEAFFAKRINELLETSDDPKLKDARVSVSARLATTDKGYILTDKEDIFVSKSGKFVDKDGKTYEVKDGKIGDIDIKDIRAQDPKFQIHITKDKDDITETSKSAIAGTKEFNKQQLAVATAQKDEDAKTALRDSQTKLDKAEAGVKASEKEKDKNSQMTAMIVMGIISGLTNIAVALCGQRNGSYMNGSGYGCGGYGNGCQGGPAVWSDKYGYARGLTVPYAYNRSNQYLSTIYNNVVKTRASIMRNNGMNAIHAGVGTTLTSAVV